MSATLLRTLIVRELRYLDRYLLFFLFFPKERRVRGKGTRKSLRRKVSRDEPPAHLFHSTAMIDALNINKVMTKYLSREARETAKSHSREHQREMVLVVS